MMLSHKNIQPIFHILNIGLISIILCACKPNDAIPQQYVPPKVNVQILSPADISLTVELPGRTTAYLIAEIRPQVNGILQKRLFEEGSLVKKDQALYQIDPAPYLATLSRAEAALESSRLLFERYEQLIKKHTVSQQEYDDAHSQFLQARAAVETARIELGYTRITVPISGRIEGAPVSGYSSGEAMKTTEAIAAKLPKGIHVAWTGLSYEKLLAGSLAPALYTLSLLIIFLCLAALYESWSIPFSVMLGVPLGVLGTLIATLMRGLGNDIFFQVGLLTTIGLSAKNAILIVEFARELYEKQGLPLINAVTEAARMRLRPIIMTSLAFIVGVIPLARAIGASSASKHAIGTGVIGGVTTATVLAVFFIPLFFVIITSLMKHKKTPDDQTKASPVHS